jgi:hypothetical protein
VAEESSQPIVPELVCRAGLAQNPESVRVAQEAVES